MNTNKTELSETSQISKIVENVISNIQFYHFKVMNLRIQSFWNFYFRNIYFWYFGTDFNYSISNELKFWNLEKTLNENLEDFLILKS